ncbi:MAG: DUF1232 domain-containing protein [Lachnospiraceae bacterium]|nr:DUF1232 domain-containing protein [Lachnospiraceae bacterium]
MEKSKLRKIIVTILIVAVVLGYDISPLDIIPDVMAGVGQLDDVIITVLGAIGVLANLLIGKKPNDNADFREI